ncbi:Hypothetical protein A7982_10162 [Minicystis rosea]|nr:Hypothetical protein A7982_10162 [Minicystis rosea]
MPFAVLDTPHIPVAQVRLLHSVSFPGQSDGVVQLVEPPPPALEVEPPPPVLPLEVVEPPPLELPLEDEPLLALELEVELALAPPLPTRSGP